MILKSSIQGLIFGLLLGISSFLYFRFVVPYHVCFKEQIQLFVFSSSYVWSYFSKPAFLACLGGDFLTQFLYFKTGGALMVTFLLVTEWRLIFLTLKRFSAETRQASIEMLRVASLLPVVVEWISYSNHNFSLSLSISIIISLSAFLIMASPPVPLQKRGKMYASYTSGLLLIPVLYMIAGASVFLFLALIIFYDIHCGRKQFIYWVIICVLAFAIPFIFRYYFLLNIKQAFLYPYPGMKQGLSLLALIIVVLCVNFINRGRIPRWLPSLGGGLVVALLLMIGLVKTTDRKQESIFGMSIEAYHENWDKVLEIMEKAELKNPIATSYANLALSKKDLLGERLMDFYQPFSSGLLLPNAPNVNWFVVFSASDAYYHIGDLDMAQHAAMFGMLSTPQQRSVRLVERLAEINMAIGDIPAATKYIRILGSTLFHKIDSESGVTNSARNSFQQIFAKDTIRKATDIKLSLELLAESNPDNLPAVNYLLCFYLLNKDIPAFYKAYTSYCKDKINPTPKVFSEALLIYFAGTKSTMKQVTEYGISPEMIKLFGEYTRLYENSKANLTTMQKKYPNTYWLFFHFATNEK